MLPSKPPGLPDAYLKLIVPQLKQLATACGLRTTGKRGEIIQRLAEVRASWQPKAPRPRLLSIDLGVRNFAMALMSPADSQTLSPITPTAPQFINDAGGRQPVLAELRTWERLELVPSDADASYFAPDRMAAMAWDLLENKVLPLDPTHIVMERQRARTMSGANVQEWTLRVNALEAMLHAMIKILNVTGRWTGTLQSVPPTSATQFWLADQNHEALKDWREDYERKEEGRKVRSLRTESLHREHGEKACTGEIPAYVPAPLKSADTKAQRMHFAKHWLQCGLIIPGTDDVRKVRAAFLKTAAEIQPGRARIQKTLREQSESFKKLDDYADCLCQGMAWLAWQRNTAILAQSEIPPFDQALTDKPPDYKETRGRRKGKLDKEK